MLKCHATQLYVFLSLDSNMMCCWGGTLSTGRYQNHSRSSQITREIRMNYSCNFPLSQSAVISSRRSIA